MNYDTQLVLTLPEGRAAAFATLLRRAQGASVTALSGRGGAVILHSLAPRSVIGRIRSAFPAMTVECGVFNMAGEFLAGTVVNRVAFLAAVAVSLDPVTELPLPLPTTFELGHTFYGVGQPTETAEP